ncbi:MAG TPA: DUF4912 domain-containing protein [Thermotogota bacterium]|nr:DUF4912 domain-containing protein [Thermotogota bacterium]
MAPKETLEQSKVSDLKEMARKKGIPGYYKMRKEELVEALDEKQGAPFDPGALQSFEKRMDANPRIFELRSMAKSLGISFKRSMKKKELKERIVRTLDKMKRVGSSAGSLGTRKVEKPVPPQPPREISLPSSYKKDTLVGLPINPNWVFFYWDFAPQTVNLLEALEKQDRQMVLRVYDVTYIIFDRNNAHRVWEYPVQNGMKKFYVNVQMPNASYLAEIGYYDDARQFIPVLRSNLVRTPPNQFSEKKEERWVDLNSGEKLSLLSKGILTNPQVKNIGLSSMDIEHLEHFRQSITSGGGSWFSKPEKKRKGGSD